MASDLEPPEKALLAAVAVMLAKAIEPKAARKAREPDGGKSLFAGQDFLAVLQNLAPNAMAYEPVATGTLVQLGRAVRGFSLTLDDAENLGRYLAGGGLAWMRDKPTPSYLAYRLADVVARARVAAATQEPEADDLARLREKGL